VNLPSRSFSLQPTRATQQETLDSSSRLASARGSGAQTAATTKPPRARELEKLATGNVQEQVIPAVLIIHEREFRSRSALKNTRKIQTRAGKEKLGAFPIKAGLDRRLLCARTAGKGKTAELAALKT
jgi:hypothetical protein